MAKKKKAPSLLTHTYPVSTALVNPGKREALEVLYASYSSEFHRLEPQEWRFFLQGKPFALQKRSTKEEATPLSQSQFQGCLSRVHNALQSHISILAEKTLHYLNRSSLRTNNPALYSAVQYLCATQAWKDYPAEYPPWQWTITDDWGNQVTARNKAKWCLPLPDEAVALANTLLRQAQKRIRFPTVRYPRMLLDSRTGLLTESEASHEQITHWLSISLLPLPESEKLKPKKDQVVPAGFSTGSRLQIPLAVHSYAENAPGKYANSVELLMRQGELTVALWKKATPDEYRAWHFAEAGEPRKNSPAVVAFDMGLCTLLASSEGDSYGQYWLDKLTEYDRRLTGLTAQRQKLGLKHYGTRQQDLVQQIRGFIKTEIGRIVNAWVRCHPNVETVVLEALNLTSSGLSKKMNRLIRQAGLPRLKAKFKELAPCYGFTVEEVQPAYTSRECRHCGWVSGNNRAKQKTFNCELCGKTNHADAHASVTVLGRSKQGLGSLTKQATLVHLRERFLANLSGRICNGVVPLDRLIHLLLKDRGDFTWPEAVGVQLTVLLQGFRGGRSFGFPTSKPAGEVELVSG